MIATIARHLAGKRHVAVGASSPIPAAAALLAQTLDPSMRISILGSEADNPFTDGGRELFDCAAQGRIDVFFFSGVQIDKDGNINLLGLGQPPSMRKRFIGNFGAPYLAGLVGEVIAFRLDHSPKALVNRVDFISAPGANVRLLVTDLAVFCRARSGFELASLHPGVSMAELQAATGFEVHGRMAETEPLRLEDEACLSAHVLPRMQRLYPQFVNAMSG